MGQKYFWCWSILLAAVLSTSSGSETQDETTPKEYLLQVNQTFSHYGNLEMEARWAYITDISEQNEVSMVSTSTSKYFTMFRLCRTVRQPLQNIAFSVYGSKMILERPIILVEYQFVLVGSKSF